MEAEHTVARLPTRALDALQPETRRALEPVIARGPLADVWLQFANSEPALRAYLAMEVALEGGALSAREIEAIKLRVSRINDCGFCLGVHAAKGRRVGLGHAAQAAIAAGTSLDEPRLDALLAIVTAFFERPGTLPEPLIDRARAAGIDDVTLMDLSMAVAAIFFTNIANHVNATGA